MYKNVKPRVDTHWNKETVKPIATRNRSKNDLENIKPAGLIRPQTIITQKSHLLTRTTSVRVKLTDLPKPSLPVLRSESQRTLIKSRSPQKSSSVELTETFMLTHSAKMLSQVEDIDQNDLSNPQLVSEYANDIYNYLYKLEREFPIGEKYLANHLEINAKMRAILIDWINEIHLQFKLELESFHMAVSIIDRYLQVKPKTARSKLQLVGVTALFFATKYEELFPPALSDFVYICDDCYKQEEILEMERDMFRALKFQLSKPLPIHFLRRFSKAAKCDDKVHVLAKYVIELASLDYNLVHHHPSEIAAASLYLALKVFASPEAVATWTPTLVFYSRYLNTQLIPITKRLALLVKEAPTTKLKAVYRKYCSSKFDAIAKNAALTSGILERFIDV